MILFDGVCHLCNGFVQFVLRHDPDGRFDFAPLQSEFSQRRLGPVSLTSIVLLLEDQVLYAEKAALYIFSQLRFPWPWLARIVGLLPDGLLAWGYRVVAKYRYRIFGKSDTCALPPPGSQGRFLS